MPGGLILCRWIFIRAKARHFQVVGDKLMPSINSIDGLGEKAADCVVEAAKDGKFLSKEDFRQQDEGQ